jgi:glycosyltransferase involved in cell wall biosynthesis
MSKIARLAIIITHPIQYYAPVFKLLAQKTPVKVFYTWGEGSVSKYDPGFAKKIEWDIDLLNGYDYQWVNNTAKNPGSHHFNGIINPDLISQINSWQPDSVLVYGWSYNSHLKVIRYFKNKIKIFFRGDSTLLDEKPHLKNWFRSIYLRWVYQHIDFAFYTGSNNKAYFKKYGLRENQLIFAPHAIDNERFSIKRTAEVQLLKQTLRINKNDILLLFAGKFEDKKNPLLLLKAFKSIQRPNLHLLYVGNGGLEEKLKTGAAGNSNIHFMDFVNQSTMPAVYQACDLFCFPSKGPGESWGLAVNEAMACGKAILIADKAGCAIDLVKENYNGLQFKSENYVNLTACLQELTASKNGLAQYGQNSAIMIKGWSFENMVNKIKDKIIHEAQ